MAAFYADINSCENGNITEPTTTSYSKSPNHLAMKDDSSDSNSNCSIESDVDFIHNDEFLKTIEDSDDITGVKCQAPYETEWSGRQFHNAMIMSVVNEETDHTVAQVAILVEVLFLNPTLEKMKPCPYFLDGKCRYALH